jgi:hypothetical protein
MAAQQHSQPRPRTGVGSTAGQIFDRPVVRRLSCCPGRVVEARLAEVGRTRRRPCGGWGAGVSPFGDPAQPGVWAGAATFPNPAALGIERLASGRDVRALGALRAELPRVTPGAGSAARCRARVRRLCSVHRAQTHALLAAQIHRERAVGRHPTSGAVAAVKLPAIIEQTPLRSSCRFQPAEQQGSDEHPRGLLRRGHHGPGGAAGRQPGSSVQASGARGGWRRRGRGMQPSQLARLREREPDSHCVRLPSEFAVARSNREMVGPSAVAVDGWALSPIHAASSIMAIIAKTLP